nr:hypothetical protein [Bradyrhizobium shewense]
MSLIRASSVLSALLFPPATASCARTTAPTSGVLWASISSTTSMKTSTPGLFQIEVSSFMFSTRIGAGAEGSISRQLWNM